jgi:hypothetical protein
MLAETYDRMNFTSHNADQVRGVATGVWVDVAESIEDLKERNWKSWLNQVLTVQERATRCSTPGAPPTAGEHPHHHVPLHCRAQRCLQYPPAETLAQVTAGH